MGPTYLSKGIIIVGLILVWFAIFFNSTIAIITALALLLVIQWRLFSFQQHMKQILLGIECHREVPVTYVRVGSFVEVRLSIGISVPGGFQAALRENVCPGIVIQKGDLDFGIKGLKTEQVELVYTAVPMVHGTFSFPGISIRIMNRFFSDEISLRNDHFNGPVLKVYPYGSYELGIGTHEYGEQEIERIRAISGIELSGFRGYVPGDSMRQIDWKMTAKFDKPVVRMYKGLGGTTPMIILDLPEQVENAIPVNFHKMVQAVSGAIEESWKRDKKSSLVLISGPNIISTPEQVGGIEPSLTLISTMAYPVKRPQTYYRFQTKGELRARNDEILRMIGMTRDNKDTHAYLGKICSIVSANQKDTSAVPAFHGEISRILRMWPHDQVIIFSLCSGDMSHIKYLIELVHHEHGTVQLHVPADSDSPDNIWMRMQSGVDSVRVFS